MQAGWLDQMKAMKNLKQGNKLIAVGAPLVDVIFKMFGHGAYIVVTYKHPDGTWRDAIVHKSKVQVPSIPTSTPAFTPCGLR